MGIHALGIAAISSCLLAALAGIASAQTVEPGPNATAKFASLEEARGILGARDEFIKAMGPLDRSARMKTGQEVPEDRFLAFVARQAEGWTEDEKKRVSGLVESLEPALGALKGGLFPAVTLVKTTGDEEGGAAYTRGDAIILPRNMIDGGDASLKRVIAHELFHILTRRNPALRDELYRAIGFEPCGAVELPEELKSRRITNPDAPVNQHCAAITVKGEAVEVVPVVYLAVEHFDPAKAEVFFEGLEMKLMVVEKLDGRRQAKRAGGKPVLLDPERVPAFLDKVGRNSPSLMHPEEILADNFAIMLMGDKRVPTPRIIELIRRILGR